MERVFVGNLPPDIRIKDIDDFFRPFGKLVYVDVNNRTNPASAFVQFDSARNAFNAVRARHGYDYEGYNIQMKLMANANNDRSFEVRNQTQQRTPPPPPPMFNDYNSQNMNNMGRYNNNSNFGNSGNFGNNDFGNNYTTDNYGNNNFMNSSSSFQNSMPSQNMVQYPTSRAIMPLQNKMIEYPSTGRYGGAGSNNAIGNSNRAGGFNRAGGSGTGSNRAGGSGTVSNRSGGVATNRSGGAATNRSGGGGSNRSGAAGSNRGGAAGSNRGGAAGSNRSGVTGSSRGGVAASNRSGGGSIRGTGGGNANTYNKNNDCYADSTFEDRFTQGLSGSGRKWFNRYIRQGFTPKQSREKALEHRTLPYLREGAGKQLDIIPNNAVPNLPLPTLENIGNKIMSLFGAAGVGSFGGNNNQMMSNLSNWVGGNIQGGFSNDFNMSGPSSSNSRRGRNRMDRDEKAPSGRNILENMLTDMPQPSSEERQQYARALGVVKRLDFRRYTGAALPKKHESMYRNMRKIVQRFEAQYKSPKGNAKQIEIPIVKQGVEKTAQQLKSEYNLKKRQLFKEAKSLPDYPHGEEIPVATQRKINKLVNNGFDERGAKILSKVSRNKIKKLIDLKVAYEASMNIRPKGVPATAVIAKPKSDKETAYQNNLKLFKKYEELNRKSKKDNLQRIIVACLKKIRQYEVEMKLPLTATKYDHLLPKATVVNKIEKKVEKKGVQPKEQRIKTKPSADAKDEAENEDKTESTAENEGENKEDANEEQDKPDDEKDEENEKKNEDQNDADKEELTEDKNDEDIEDLTEDKNDENIEELTEDNNDQNENAVMGEELNEKELLEEDVEMNTENTETTESEDKKD